jgi:hypothetical protein
MFSALHQTPGLSALADGPTLGPATLGTPRYRLWVDRLVLRIAAEAVKPSRAGGGKDRRSRRIGFPSPASGTLARLP